MAAMPFSPCDAGQPTCDDVTVGILQHIFGPIIDVLVKGTDPNTVQASSNLLATMFVTFNSGILVVGSIIIAYVIAMGAINTANDGEAMGKAWSTVWTPVRIVAGAGVLLPSTSGYSFIQMLVLMISLWSIGFANGIYKLGMGMGVLKPDGIVASSSAYQSGTYFGLRDFAKQYLGAAYCARAANTIYADAAGNPMVMADSNNPDKKTVTGTRTDHTFFIKDRNAATNLGGGEPICGTVTLTSYTASGTYSDTSGTQAALDNIRASLMSQKLSVAVGLMQDIDNWVATMPSDINQPGWGNVMSSQFNTIVKNREDQVAAAIASQMTNNEGAVNTGVDAFVNSMTKEGWAMAGGWYQRVGILRTKISTITGESAGAVTSPSLSGLPADARASLLKGSVSTVSETISKKAEQAGNGYDGSTAVKPEDLASMLPKDISSDINVGSLDADMSTKTTLMMNGMMQKATDLAVGSGSNVDAISRMKMTGDLLSSYQAMLWMADVTIKTAITAARIVANGMGVTSVVGVNLSGMADDVWDWALAVPVPILAKMASYIGLLAFYFGVALPSMPYTMFMIAVVGWVLGVLQTTIAAPLWAIMHTRPSQTFVGSEAQGYLLLMALFVRPALAVIGLFAAMLVADPVVDYIAKAFFAMRGDVASSTGWIGVLAQFTQFFWWFAVFGGLLLPVLFMIFGLPQVLPDRVLAWLNVGVHDLGATGAGSAHQGRLTGSAERANQESMGKLPGNQGGGQGPRRPGGPTGLPGGDGGGGGGSGGGSRRGNMPMNANHQGVAPVQNEMGSAPQPQRGMARSALAAGAKGEFGARVGEGLGVALGRMATDTGYAIKDAADGTGTLGRNMKDALVSAGSEGASAFRTGAESRITNFKAVTALRDSLQGPPGPSKA